jgi:hypothetical protein
MAFYGENGFFLIITLTPGRGPPDRGRVAAPRFRREDVSGDPATKISGNAEAVTGEHRHLHIRLRSVIRYKSRPGSGSGPSPKFGLRLLLNKPKAQAQTGLGLGVGPRARAYLVKARAWPKPSPSLAQAQPKPGPAQAWPEVYSPSPARARSFLARPSPTHHVLKFGAGLFEAPDVAFQRLPLVGRVGVLEKVRVGGNGHKFHASDRSLSNSIL